MHDLIRDGNSVLLVDHDTQILKESDWLVEMGRGAGADGGTVIAEGTIQDIAENKTSVIGPYLSGAAINKSRSERKPDFSDGVIHMETDSIHTVKPLTVDIPKHRLTVITGVSGSGKTTMVLEALFPRWKPSAMTNECPITFKKSKRWGFIRSS